MGRYELVILALIGAIGCGGHDSVSSRLKAQELWRQQQKIIEIAAGDKNVNPRAFSDACSFFSRVAGITIPGDSWTFGDWQPSDDTGKVLPTLREWYKANKDRLYWDAEEGMVEVSAAPATGGVGKPR